MDTHTYIFRKDHYGFHDVISEYKFIGIVKQTVVTKLLNFALTVHKLNQKVWYQLIWAKSHHR